MNARILISLVLYPMASVAFAEGKTTDIWEGVFTEEQVERGEEAYMSSCAVCHGEDLVGVDAETPTLTEPAFRWSWQQKTIGEKFDRMRETMPLNEPGGLEDQTYADITAYILHFNGYPAGETELEPDLERLGQIEISLDPD